MIEDRDELVFASEHEDEVQADSAPWKVLIADDEREIHEVTHLALDGLQIHGRPVVFLDAYSGHEAVALLERQPDIALVLMDVVMESDSAGLDAVEHIRTRLDNHDVRIVLRTGQPGQAPEREVLTRYDINDYKEKTDLTAKKLFTLVYTSLSLYRELAAIRRSRDGIERLAEASATVFRRRQPERLAQGVLRVLASLIGVDQSRAQAFEGVALADAPGGVLLALAGIGRHEGLAGPVLEPELLGLTLRRLEGLSGEHPWSVGPRHFAARFDGSGGSTFSIHLESETPWVPLEPQICDLFCRNVSTALRMAQLHEDVERTQRELIMMLSEAIEKRSRETGHHVRRVGEYCRLLGRLSGLGIEECATLFLSSPLHDAGKIAIPDAILNKPGRLTDDEMTVMRTHAQVGADIFANQSLPVLAAAAIIAGQHHEKWDGSGYPHRIAGEQIHLYGRIAALADVFDALASHRCYKKAWPMPQVLDLLREERGRHFDPKLIDLLLGNLDAFLEIHDRLADPAPETA